MPTATARRFLGDLDGQSLRDDSRGVYPWKEWEFASVTRILQAVSKPVLQGWYARRERDYIRERLQAMKRGQISARDLYNEFGEGTQPLRGEQIRDERSEIGRRVHKEATIAVLRYTNGEPYTLADVAEDIRPYAQSFWAWLVAERPAYWAIEAAVFSREYGYAGTLDGILEIHGNLRVIDYKISGRTWHEHALQIAAYRRAEFIGHLDKATETPMPDTVGGSTLLIHPDRCVYHEWPTGPDEFSAFLAAQRLSEWLASTPAPKEIV